MTVDLTKPPTLDQALALLEAAVAERGADYIYAPVKYAGEPEETCTYVDPITREPSCGVGLAMVRYGVPIEDLMAADYCDVTGDRLPVLLWPDYYAQPGRAEEAERLGRLLGAFQARQDNGVTWGASLGWAKHVAGATRSTEKED